MQKYSTLPIGEKIKLIRNAKGLSQENVAKAVNSSESTLSRIEQGQAECSTEMLTAIKEYLSIKNAPLFEHELKIYEDQLWVLNDLTNARRLTDAKDMQKSMFTITELPFERDLSILYSMINVRLLLWEQDLDTGEEELNNVEQYIEDASSDAKHLYYRSRGVIASHRGDLKVALKHYLQVINLQTDNLKADAPLYNNIGTIYRKLGKLFHAIRYHERALWECAHDRTHMLKPYINTALCECYALVGEFDNVMKMAEEALSHANGINDKMSIGNALSCKGGIYSRIGNHEEALMLYNQSLPCYEKDSPEYLICILNKAKCLNKMKNYSESKELIKQGMLLAEGNEMHILLFKTQLHSMTLNDSQSVDYIESVAIPYFKVRDVSSRAVALDCCDTLESHYKKKGSQKKAMAIAVVARDIYKEMMYGVPDTEST
ncbi:MAG: helix-turn-helix transcriptional regulator [Defluviitaleaceae bacterium]|nr:helix-turn-helix transcriptional regulator [Defluviitaleaceae bacterium]